jgi:ABC-2 type transport system ATP-binding protein
VTSGIVQVDERRRSREYQMSQESPFQSVSGVDASATVAASTRAMPNSPPVKAPRQGIPALECRNLYRFFGRLKAVNNVSFKAWPGQVLGFIGPNGAGKSTTMKILATLEAPTAGDAFIHGHSVLDQPDIVRTKLGFMPDAFGKYPNMDVVEYLDFFARAYGMKGDKRRDAIERVLVFTELRKLAHKPIDSLSKGMSQRLGLGRCLISDPDVLIMDEPAAGLDPRARIELRELINILSRQMKKTILISSHILTELSEMCDAAAIIEAGKIIATGTIEDLRDMQRRNQGRTAAVIQIRVLSKVELLERWLNEQPFVSMVATTGNNSLAFQFEGDEPARAQLLREMLSNGHEISEFQGKVESLEDAFMAITKGITQ